MSRLELSCACGQVQGYADNVSPKIGTHVRCYCDDCQRFANWLEHKNPILDGGGGTNIFQVPMARLKITQGAENIACIRLKRKGTYRWYSTCCNTPIANSFGASMPFASLISPFWPQGAETTNIVGPVRGNLMTKFAVGPLTDDASGSEKGVMFTALSRVFYWKIRGWNRPNALFKDNGHAISKPVILDDPS